MIVGQGASCYAYLIPNIAGGTTLLNSSGQFVGLGMGMQSCARGASGFNCYSGGAWKYGRTVRLEFRRWLPNQREAK